jgi:CHAD domain-containing protein
MSVIMDSIDQSYQHLACHYIHRQLDVLIEQMDGARQAEDIECVHQTRVASRRLRAALSMFDECFPEKKIRKWQKEIKRLTKGLGPARDKDVLIRSVRKTLEKLPKDKKSCSAGIKRVLLRLRQERQKAQPKVVKAMDRLEKGAILADIHGEVEKALFGQRKDDAPFQSPYILEKVCGRVHSRLDKFLSQQDVLADPQDELGHHRMRIEAKRLRYTLEICNLAYEKEIGPTVKVMKKLQSLLGELHDCDVWTEQLQAFVERERRRTEQYYGHTRPMRRLEPGIDYLSEERRNRREEVFNELNVYWNEISRDEVWESLIARLESRREPHDDHEPAITPTEIENGDTTNHNSSAGGHTR